MARIAIESQAARAAQGPLETKLQEVVIVATTVGLVAAALDPGILLGAALAGVWRWRSHPTLRTRVLRAALIAVPLIGLYPLLVLAWPWRSWLTSTGVLQLSTFSSAEGVRSLFLEALAGPLWLEGASLMLGLRERTVQSQLRRDHRLDERRWRAISEQRQPALPWRTTATGRTDAPTPPHPRGFIRIGVDLETNAPLDLRLPDDLSVHVFLPGASQSGKTNTLGRLADGALANGYGIAIIDCKAGGLGSTARKLAARYGLPFRLVDPDDPRSLGYNPCSGDASAVANKVVGTFSFGPGAEIYKNIAMEAVPVAVRGLQAAHEPVTLDALYDVFAPRGLTALADRVTGDDRLCARLRGLEATSADRVSASGRAGFQRRLGALLEGKFGPLFRTQPMLDWKEAAATPSVAYVALSALASSEDVDLMGRVIVQDLKQLCAYRLRQLGDGAALHPMLVVLDEFAALDEPEQILDLLRQAREALMSIVISTQQLPLTPELADACLASGLIIAHRLAVPDAEQVAAQFGTRSAIDVTHQIDYATGFSEKGSVRRVDKYNVNPNEFRELLNGQAALKSVAGRRYTIVRVYKNDA